MDLLKELERQKQGGPWHNQVRQHSQIGEFWVNKSLYLQVRKELRKTADT